MKPSIEIDTLSIGVPVEHPKRGRRPQPAEVIHIELGKSGLCLWDEWHQMCREVFTFTPGQDPRIATHISQMPHLDAAFGYITKEWAVHRADMVGAFLEPAALAMESAIAARDGSSVYFADAGGQIKIGWSRQVARRLVQLQTGSASPIQLIGTMPGGRAVERRVHERFAHLRLSGEWFTAAPELLAFIATLTPAGEPS